MKYIIYTYKTDIIFSKKIFIFQFRFKKRKNSHKAEEKSKEWKKKIHN